MILARELGDTFCRLLKDDPRVVILGEDIADPYGGAFKVTRGLSFDFPDRVRTTPISEAAITGLAAGLALGGFRPIVEIMFGDFITLCFDQIVNHIAKYQPMYNGRTECPVIIRTPSGGGRGYGPTHSQSLEKHFLGVPHLRVIAASLHHDPYLVFRSFLQQSEPVLYIEHKLLYPQHLILPEAGRLGDFDVHEDQGVSGLSTLTMSVVPRQDCSVTVLAYGYQALVAEQVIQKLAMEEEIFAELLIPAQIAPMDWAPVEQSVEATKSLITVEEGTGGWSWGSEVAAELGGRLFHRMRHPVRVLASERSIVPSARHLEVNMLMNARKIEQAIREVA